MAFELILLVWSTVLLLAHIGTQAVLLTRQLGSRYNAGPRDEERPLEGLAGRAKRALANFLETYPAFIALAAATILADTSSLLTQTGATLYLGARVLYLPLYLSGIPYLRSIVWLASLLGLVLMGVGVLT